MHKVQNMKYMKFFVASAFLLGLFAQTANAQDYSSLDYKPYPYVFVNAQGGIQATFTDYQAGKLITPVTSLSVGSMFNPVVGARLNFNGWKCKGGLKSIDQTYKFNYLNSNLDLMINLTNIVMPKQHVYPFNVYLLGGVGLTYAWDNNQMLSLSDNAPDPNLTYIWDDDRLVHNFRAGVQAEWNISKHFAVNLEVNANNMADRFNSKVNHRGDWQVQALAGVTVKFGHRKKDVSSMTSTAAQNNYNNNQNAATATAGQVVAPSKPEQETIKPVVKPQPKKEVVKEEQKVNIFFKINESQVAKNEQAKLDKVAKWLQENPHAKVQFMGYADADTGTATYNQKLSKKRAEQVTEYLVKKYGISRSRIIVDAKGDTVQPFSDNDMNRVVIGIVK